MTEYPVAPPGNQSAGVIALASGFISIIFGALGLIICMCLGPIGLLVGCVAVGFGSQTLRATGEPQIMGIIGLVLGIIGVVLGLIGTLYALLSSGVICAYLGCVGVALTTGP